MPQSYGHDIVSARLIGAARRVREAVFTAYAAAAHWTHQSDPSPTLRLYAVIECTLEEGFRAGATEEDLRLVLSRLAERSNPLVQPDWRRPRDQYRATTVMYSDPSSELTWEQFDDQVDQLSEDDLRRALKKEARLRRDANLELAQSRGEDVGQS